MSVKGATESTSCCTLPSAPTSVGSWFGNRVIALVKTGISACTFVLSGLSSIVPLGSPGERFRRAGFAFGSMLQGARQFFYTADQEDYSRAKITFGTRLVNCFQIANFPPYNTLSDARADMTTYEGIKSIFKNSLYRSSKEEDVPLYDSDGDVGQQYYVNPQDVDFDTD